MDRRNYGAMLRDVARAQRRGDNGFSARDAMRLLALVCLLVSGFFWFPIRWQVVGPTTVPEALIALSSGLFMVFGPPILTSFLIPWTPTGMLLQRLNIRTVGYAVVIGCALFLLYFAFIFQESWWSTRPVIVAADMVRFETIVGLISSIIVPALIWAPVGTDELIETARQAHLVKRYELQVNADIAILQRTLFRAQELAVKDLADLTDQERSWLAGALKGLVTGMDQTLRELAGTVERVSETSIRFQELSASPDIAELLAYITDTLYGDVGHDAGYDALPAPPPAALPAPPATRTTTPLVVPASAAPASNDAYTIARQHLNGAWTREQLEAVLQVRRSKATDLIRTWAEAGYVSRVDNPRHHYAWSEQGGQP
jgi:hypothetical protein